MRFLVNYSWIGKRPLGILFTFIYFFLLGLITTWIIDFRIGINGAQWAIAIFMGLLFGAYVFIMGRYIPLSKKLVEHEKTTKKRSKWVYIIVVTIILLEMLLLSSSPFAMASFGSVLLFAFGAFLIAKFFKRMSLTARLIYTIGFWIPMSKLLFDFAPIEIQELIVSPKLWRGLSTLCFGFMTHYLIVDWLRRKSS